MSSSSIKTSVGPVYQGYSSLYVNKYLWHAHHKRDISTTSPVSEVEETSWQIRAERLEEPEMREDWGNQCVLDTTGPHSQQLSCLRSSQSTSSVDEGRSHGPPPQPEELLMAMAAAGESQFSLKVWPLVC